MIKTITYIIERMIATQNKAKLRTSTATVTRKPIKKDKEIGQ